MLLCRSSFQLSSFLRRRVKMDGFGCLMDWLTEDAEFPLSQTKNSRFDHELMEILWNNGGVVLHCQNRSDSKFNHIDEDVQQVSLANETTDESFHNNLCADQVTASHQLSGKSDNTLKFSNAEALMIPSEDQHETLDDLQFAYKDGEVPVGEKCFIAESSIMEKEIRHGSADQVVQNSLESGFCGNVSHKISAEKPMVVPEYTPAEECGDGYTKATSQSSDNTKNKRKMGDVEEPEYPSDATEELRSPDGNKKPASRRRRVPHVHNLSERKRRDRINEKLRALQALIPHSQKLDKASLLDQAIEYMKSLQAQLQQWRMGNGTAPLILHGTPHQYMYHAGVRNRPLPFPPTQNLKHIPNQVASGHGRHNTHNQTSNAILNPVSNTAQPRLSSRPAQETNMAAQPHNGKSQMDMRTAAGSSLKSHPR